MLRLWREDKKQSALLIFAKRGIIMSQEGIKGLFGRRNGGVHNG